MKIELTLTITQARKVLKALDGPSVTDPVIAGVHEELAHYVGEHDAIKAMAPPWRKVIDKYGTGVHRFDRLECGHSYMLRQTKNWIEEHGTRRRCEQCRHASERGVAAA